MIEDNASLQLVIQVVPGKDMTLSGPIGDQILCLGLLEAAKDVLRQHHEELSRRANGSGIAIAHVLPRM